MTYQATMRLEDALADDLKAFAGAYGISIADAIRILLIKGLADAKKNPART